MNDKRRHPWPLALAMLAAACSGQCADGEMSDELAVRDPGAAEAREPIDPRCVLPVDPVTVREDGSAILLVWTFPDAAVFSDSVVPADSAFLAYRAAIRGDGGAVRDPIADEPQPRNAADAAVARAEAVNRRLAERAEVGIVEPIRCLDALLFSYQNARISQLTHPTEFLASVLRRHMGGRTHLTVVFGAGEEMFPPKTVYGFDVAEARVTAGWEFWYALHNHTLQRNGERLALGAPALSTSDVQLMRSLARDLGLRSARVTNGFYTYTVAAGQLDRLRSR